LNIISIVIYNFIIYFGFMIYLPVLIFKMVKTGKYRHSFWNRLGFGLEPKNIAKSDKTIWLHAVSVGETLATLEFQKALKEKFPEYKLLFTVTTETGYKIACEKCKFVDEILYFPMDFQFAVNSFLNKFDIKLFIMTETEVWPNLLRILKKRNILSAIINGRISDRSLINYRRFKFIFKSVFELIDGCYMQSDVDMARIIEIGAKKENTLNTGNLKYDEMLKYRDYNIDEVYEKFGYLKTDKIYVAGSIHPGEYKVIVDSALSLKAKQPDFKIIIAPRKFDKLEPLFAYLQEKNINYKKRSDILKKYENEYGLKYEKDLRAPEFMILDTLGELVKTYAMARVVFIGGSLIEVGGHNILEPAVFKKPVIFGKYMHNFREMSESFIKSGAGVMVNDKNELETALNKYSDEFNPDYIKASNAAYLEVTGRTGAISKNILRLQSLLNSDKI